MTNVVDLRRHLKNYSMVVQHAFAKDKFQIAQQSAMQVPPAADEQARVSTSKLSNTRLCSQSELRSKRAAMAAVEV